MRVLASAGLVSFFFFKQKTAYEMRISDWSSDVCSSDLQALAVERIVVGTVHGAGVVPDQQVADLPFMTIDVLLLRREFLQAAQQHRAVFEAHALDVVRGRAEQQRVATGAVAPDQWMEIGRASVRERVCQYVSILGEG